MLCDTVYVLLEVCCFFSMYHLTSFLQPGSCTNFLWLKSELNFKTMKLLECLSLVKKSFLL